MMDQLIRKGEALAKRHVAVVRTQVKAALREELPEHVAVEETGGGVELRGPDLASELLHNSSLRDVAFLMRGVR